MIVDVTIKSIQGDIVLSVAADCAETVADVLARTTPAEHHGQLLERCTLYHNVSTPRWTQYNVQWRVPRLCSCSRSTTDEMRCVQGRKISRKKAIAEAFPGSQEVSLLAIPRKSASGTTLLCMTVD